jgi:hypothetical protein
VVSVIIPKKSLLLTVFQEYSQVLPAVKYYEYPPQALYRSLARNSLGGYGALLYALCCTSIQKQKLHSLRVVHRKASQAQ